VSDRQQPPGLKVLRIIARLNLGGPARHVILLNRGLRSRGHETLLVHGSLDTGEATLEHLAVGDGLPTLKLPGLARRLHPLADLRTLARLLALIFREQPDIVHTHTAKAGTLGRIAAFLFNATHRRRRRSVIVHTFHGHVLHGYFGPVIDVIVRLTELALALITDRIVTISPAQQRDIVERFQVATGAKTVVIALGLDLTTLLQLAPGEADSRQELSIEPGDVVFGFVGRMVPIKDLGTLMSAFKLTLAVCPNAVLLLVGDGPLRPTFEDTVRSLGISHRVRFAGWNEDLAPVYATIDVLVLSSLNEGTPVAIIEAMAAGKPAIATAVGGIPDLVADGTTGILVRPRAPEALAEAMRRLANDGSLRRQMGAAARVAAQSRFGVDRLVDEIEALYREALERKRAGL
jgi:glycosyltransferase involved in cell wall biosynthesis